MLTYFADDRGARYVPSDVVPKVAKAASAPLYSPYPTGIGSGVGGWIFGFQRVWPLRARRREHLTGGRGRAGHGSGQGQPVGPPRRGNGPDRLPARPTVFRTG